MNKIKIERNRNKFFNRQLKKFKDSVIIDVQILHSALNAKQTEINNLKCTQADSAHQIYIQQTITSNQK